MLLAIKGIPEIIMIIVSIPVIASIMRNFTLYHLYSFAPHFIIYPYDYFSSANDTFHIVEKISLSIAIQSPIPALNEFLYIFSFVLQISNLIYSIYIFFYQSFATMSNVFLNKVRISLMASSVIINIILILLRNKNYLTNTFLIISINIFLGVFVFVQIFYCQNLYVYIFHIP